MTTLDSDTQPRRAQRAVDTKEIVFGIAVVALVAVIGLDLPLEFAPLIGTGFLAALGLYDGRTSTIHRHAVRTGTAAVLIATAIEAARIGEWSHLIAAIVAAIALYLIFLPIWMLPSRPLGGGDLRLAALIGAIVGPYGVGSVAFAIFAGFAIAALIGLPVILITKRKAMPLGPGLAAGSIIALLTAAI